VTESQWSMLLPFSQCRRHPMEQRSLRKKWNSLVAAKPHKEENFVKYFFIMQLRCYEKALNFYYFRKNIKVNVRLFLTINTWHICTLARVRETVRWLTIRQTRRFYKIFLKNRIYRLWLIYIDKLLFFFSLFVP